MPWVLLAAAALVAAGAATLRSPRWLFLAFVLLLAFAGLLSREA